MNTPAPPGSASGVEWLQQESVLWWPHILTTLLDLKVILLPVIAIDEALGVENEAIFGCLSSEIIVGGRIGIQRADILNLVGGQHLAQGLVNVTVTFVNPPSSAAFPSITDVGSKPALVESVLP